MIYKNVSFCQKGCKYNGINYEYFAANSICNSNNLQNSSSINKTNDKNTVKALSLTIIFYNIYSKNFYKIYLQKICNKLFKHIKPLNSPFEGNPIIRIGKLIELPLFKLKD